MATALREAWHTLPGLDAARALHVERASGLSSQEARARLAEMGRNRLALPEPEATRTAFLRHLAAPAQLVLLAAAVASGCLGQVAPTFVLVMAALLNAALGMLGEGAPGRATATLRELPEIRAHVRRDGELVELEAGEIVPGDVVRIARGDVVPAEGRLLQSATLELDESALTGKTAPAAKATPAVDDPDALLRERTDMVYMRTRVTRGSGEFVVTATGMETELGAMAGLLAASRAPRTPAIDSLRRLSRTMLLVAAPLLAIALAAELARGASGRELTALAAGFAVAAVPSAGASIMTALLATGARALPHARVERLDAIDTLGAVTALVLDNTGTMTLNELTAAELVLPGRRFTASGRGYRAAGSIRHAAGPLDAALDALLLPMALTSDADVTDRMLRGDPRDGALVVLAEKGGLDVAATREAYPRIAELPFDAGYALNATFHRAREGGGEVIRCFAKGEPSALLARAAFALDADLRRIAVDTRLRNAYVDEHARLRRRGMEVVALARRDLDPAVFEGQENLLALVEGLTLLALVGIVDPPRRHAREAVEAIRDAGIRVRMITGESAAAAVALARRLGLGESDVIARAGPASAVRIVAELRAEGHVVAATGHGLSDAPALVAADAGIAMHARADAVAKDAAAVIVDGGLRSIVASIASARATSVNLARYRHFQAAMLAGAILTCFAAGVLGLVRGLPFAPLPMLGLSFTVIAFQSLALRGAGGRPAPLGVVALTQAAGTLAVIALAEHMHGVETARAMGIVTFGLASVAYSLTLRRPDRAPAVASLASLAAIAALGLLSPGQELGSGDWLLCLAGALPVLGARTRPRPHAAALSR